MKMKTFLMMKLFRDDDSSIDHYKNSHTTSECQRSFQPLEKVLLMTSVQLINQKLPSLNVSSLRSTYLFHFMTVDESILPQVEGREGIKGSRKHSKS